MDEENAKKIIESNLQRRDGLFIYAFQPYWSNNSYNSPDVDKYPKGTDYRIDLNCKVSSKNRQQCIDLAYQKLNDTINNISNYLTTGNSNSQ